MGWECIYFILQNDDICEWKVSGLNFNWLKRDTRSELGWYLLKGWSLIEVLEKAKKSEIVVGGAAFMSL